LLLAAAAVGTAFFVTALDLGFAALRGRWLRRARRLGMLGIAPGVLTPRRVVLRGRRVLLWTLRRRGTLARWR
jgi:hypothetical protein